MDFNLALCLKHDQYPPRWMSSCTHLPEKTGSDWELTVSTEKREILNIFYET